MKTIILKLFPIFDFLLMAWVGIAAFILKLIRRAGVHRLPLCKTVLLKVGVFPIRNHYYEPQFDFGEDQFSGTKKRLLRGIDLNVEEQLKMLGRFTFSQELQGIPSTKTELTEFHFNNLGFESGDAEYWYQLIRSLKPKRIFEVGSGYSTLIATKAVAENRKNDSSYQCNHTCIEPYEMPWLEELEVTVLRKKVEEVDLAFFSELEENDILFIDSSHVIRSGGDVLFEYLEVLPSLSPGVIVHVHDIFSPRDYPTRWIKDEVRFWNEQYLLEAFLSSNREWKIIGALNYLFHDHYEELKCVAPYLTSDREPGSFYLQKGSLNNP